MSAPSPRFEGHDDEQVHGHGMPRAGHADCSEVLLRVYEYIDREMSAADHARMAAHLQGCEGCLDAYQRDLLLKALVQRSCACEQAPETLRLSIMTRITMVQVEYDDEQ